MGEEVGYGVEWPFGRERDASMKRETLLPVLSVAPVVLCLSLSLVVENMARPKSYSAGKHPCLQTHCVGL